MTEIPLMQPWITQAEHDLVDEVLESGWLAEGHKAQLLEEEVEAYLGVDHAIVTPSCTAALHLALLAVETTGIGALIPDYTWPATAQAAHHAGFTPFLVDVNSRTYSVDPQALHDPVFTRPSEDESNGESYTMEDVAVAIPVSQFGRPLDTGVYQRLRDHDVPIVEDAAPSLGATIDGHPVGNHADVTCFSLYAAKHLTSGEGGIAVTNDDELAERMETLKDFGMRDDEAVAWGMNYNMSDVNAAIGLAQVRRLDDIIERRQRRAFKYTTNLDGINGVRPPATRTGHAYQSYAIKVKWRDELIEFLEQNGIEADIGTTSLHTHSVFESLPRTIPLGGSKAADRGVIRLPLFHELSGFKQMIVIDTVRKFYNE